MAGSTGLPGEAGFDSAAFRSAIAGVMTMSAPNDPTERVQFVFHPARTYENEDPAGNPYSWDAAPATETGGDGAGNPRYVEIPVAIEFVSRTSQARDTSLGYMLPSHVDLYILDTYIDEVQGADEVLIDGNLYNINAWYPPIGLFDVTLYSVTCEAIDES